MEGGEAAPRVDNKQERNNENNSRLPKSINFLTSILYFFFLFNWIYKYYEIYV